MGTAILRTKPTRAGSITLDSWQKILTLAQEPNRHGQAMWVVRLSLGDLPPWRYGPFETEKAARIAYSTLIEFVDKGLSELGCEAGNRSGAESNEEH